MVVISSVFPSIIRSKNESLKKYYNRLQQLHSVMAAMAIFIAVVITICSQFLVVVLYGEEFSSAGIVLSIHVWAGIFVFLGVVRSKWIVNENYQIYGMIFNLSGAIVNILLNVFFIPRYGILGAAWATVISQALSATFLAILFHKTRVMFFMHIKSITGVLLLFPAYKDIKEIYHQFRN